MKKRLGTSVLCIVFLVLMSSHLAATINFGSRDSSIKITSGTFNVASSNLNFDGTLHQATSGSITGNSFAFDNGILRHDGSEALMTANFNPSGGDTINLAGSDSLWGEPGTIVKQVNVSGLDNKVEGHLNLENPINLADSSTLLNVGIQSVLNQDINLNGGRIILQNDLRLADNVQLNGAGTVEFNGYQLGLGGFYSATSPWATDLTFKGATDLTLNGNVALTADWTFEQNCVINGNGCILDLSDGGSITVSGSDGVLYLNDIHIRGLADTLANGNLIFDADGARLILNNVTVELAGEFTTNIGEIIIDGTTTFLLKNYDWNFGALGLLTVNDRLWIDVYYYNGEAGNPAGQIMAPNAMFLYHTLDWDEVNANILAGNLAMGPNGTIKEITDRSQGLSAAALVLISETILENINLDVHVDIIPGQVINITVDGITIDGGGTVVTFSNQTDPQFIVAPGVSVTLQNITLTRINFFTFQLGEGSIIYIGENVIFELIEDVMFNYGQFIVLPEMLSRVDDGNIFTIRGLGGKRRWTFLPYDPNTLQPFPLGPVDPNITAAHMSMNLGTNGLLLQSIELSGLEYILFDQPNDPLVDPAASIILGGETSVLVEGFWVYNDYFEQFQEVNQMGQTFPGVGMNFNVENPGNELILLNDAITLAGSIGFFGATGVNELGVRFSLPEVVSDVELNFGPREGVPANYPLVNLGLSPENGDVGGVFLTADQGVDGVLLAKAGIVFPGPRVAIRNMNDNAFVTDANSFIHAQELFILDNPIKNQDSSLEVVIVKEDGEGFANEYARSGSKKVSRTVTTYSKVREKQLKQRKRIKRKQAKKARKQYKKLKRKGRKKRKILRGHSIEDTEMTRALDFDVNEKDLAPAFLAKVRALSLSTAPYDVKKTTVNLNNAAADNIELDSTAAIMSNFYTAAGTPFNFVLKNGATLEQSLTNDVSLDPNQFINIDKADDVENKIVVKRTFEVNDNFRVAPNARLTVEFSDEGETTPVFRFTADTQFDLEKGAVIRFRGKGIVELDANVVINMKGVSTAVVDKYGAPVMDEYGRPTYTIAERPLLDIGPDVQVRVINEGNAFITGIGRIKCTGNLEPNNGTLHLWPRSEDDIILEFNNGKWIIDNGSAATTGLGTGAMDFNNSQLQVINGELSVNDKSVLPVLRALGDTLVRGYIKDISFKGNSKIIVQENGKISWGLNEAGNPLREVPMNFAGSSLQVVVEDGGTFELVTRPAAQEPGNPKVYRGIEEALIQSRAKGFFKKDLARAQDVAILFANVNDNLTNGSIEFVTPAGERKVRTADSFLQGVATFGRVVDLQANDVIQGDRIVTVNGVDRVEIFGTRGGSNFVINQDGTFNI